MSVGYRVPSALLLIVSLGVVSTSCAPTTPRFTAPPDFSLRGRWEGSFTNTLGARFAQTMIIEEERGDELRGRYIGYRGNEVAGGLRGRLKLPGVVFTLQDTDFTLTLISANEMRGYTSRSPGEGAAGSFEFTRRKE